MKSIVSIAIVAVMSFAFCSAPQVVHAQIPVPGSAYSFMYFPHIAVGGPAVSQWQTVFTLTNPNTYSVTGTIALLGDEGEPLPLDFGSSSRSDIPFSLEPSETREFRSRATGSGVQGGWAILEATSAVMGVATYQLLQNGQPLFAISVVGRIPTILYTSPAMARTGIAVGNIYDETRTLRFIAEGNDGSEFMGTLAVPPSGHRGLHLNEAIPELPGDFVGTLTIQDSRLGVDNFLSADAYFAALTLRNDGGVYSSLPDGAVARPVSQWHVIQNVFAQLREAVKEFFTKFPNPDTIELSIGFEPEINASGSREGIQINMALAELLGDSESELAFIVGHELGHVYQFRTGAREFTADNDELDADGWGMFLALLSGYDVYAGAGALAKLEMANGQADLESQYLQEFTDVHMSFNTRLDFIYDTIVDLCEEEDWMEICILFHDLFHPNVPGPL